MLFLLITLTSGIQAVQAEKIKIEKLDDLPRHTYKIDVKAVDLFENDAALMKLVSEVKADLLSDLETYDIQDKTTLKGFYSNLSTIALLEKDYYDYLLYLIKRKEIEEKESLRLISGLFTRAYIKALNSKTGGLEDAFRREYTKLVVDLPFELVEDELESTKGQTEIFTKNLLIGIINERTQPVLDQSDGEMSKDIATSLLGFNYSVRYFIPLKDIIGEILKEYLDAHKVIKEDIWEAREAALDKKMKGHPVVAAIWDSGVDTDCYKDQLFTNKKEKPGNGKDDDKNGFIDDVHGIAYTLHGDKTTEMLYPIGDIDEDRPRLQKLMKGLTDLTSNIDSEESSEIKKYLTSMNPQEVKPFIEDIGKYGNFCHGTHVAGIAARGNPFIEILAARLTFGHTMIPEEPTVELAEKDALMYQQVVDYFKDNDVRVVNMSWGGSLASIESALEANNAGGTPEERKAFARKLFEIDKEALYKAINEAPEILFVTSAGNANNDVTFEEFLPSSFDLPNIMSIGAVDQAGDETSFTSFGKVDVYANGFEVWSCVPGGDKLKLSGTSQASPNVTNLAAKLFAIDPDLTPVEVRELIAKGCDEKMAGNRPVKLINPKNTVELLMQHK